MYTIGVFGYLGNVALRGALIAEAGTFPSDATMYLTLRGEVAALAPDNAAELIAMIDRAMADPTDAVARGVVAAIEQQCSAGNYGVMLEARARYIDAEPYVLAARMLVGWEGPDLPAFRQERERPMDRLLVVPKDLLQVVADLGELELIGRQAARMMQPGYVLAARSAPPPPPPAARPKRTRKRSLS